MWIRRTTHTGERCSDPTVWQAKGTSSLSHACPANGDPGWPSMSNTSRLPFDAKETINEGPGLEDSRLASTLGIRGLRHRQRHPTGPLRSALWNSYSASILRPPEHRVRWRRQKGLFRGPTR